MLDVQAIITLPVIEVTSVQKNPFAISLVREMGKESASYLKAIGRITRSWSPEDRPRFKVVIDRQADLMSVTASTRSVPYAYVTAGTRIRHAVMTRNFRPRTRRGTFGSRAKVGRVAHVSRSIRKRGIEARRFEFDYADKREVQYARNMQRAINIVASRFFDPRKVITVRVV